MKKKTKISLAVLPLLTTFIVAGCSCGGHNDTNGIKLTVWVSESDKAFASAVVEDFKQKNPDKIISL